MINRIANSERRWCFFETALTMVISGFFKSQTRSRFLQVSPGRTNKM